MLKFNNGFNTFDSDSYSVRLDNPNEPNLFREIFPYNTVPKIGFNHRLSPLRVPDAIWITDTSLRDGQQSMPPYTAKQVVDLYKMLHRLGGPKGLIRQSEFFCIPKEIEMQSAGYRNLVMSILKSRAGSGLTRRI